MAGMDEAEGRKEGRKKGEEGTRGVSVKQICSWEQSRLHLAKQADLWEHRILLVPYPNPKPKP
jgi:hypothetical protein